MSEQVFKPQQLEKALALFSIKKTDLAGALGLSPKTITAYLAGTIAPSFKVLELLLKEIPRLPLEWYYLPDQPKKTENEEKFAYRSKLTTSKQERMKNESLKDIFSNGLQYLSGFFKAPPAIRFVQAPDLELLREQDTDQARKAIKNEIDKLAREQRALWGLGNAPISSLVAHAEANGIWCTRISGVEKVDAFSFWVTPDLPFVLLNNNKSAVRTRFDLAHEIGHLIIHQNINWRLYRSDSKYRKQIEDEADCFASCFLLPEESFGLHIRELGLSLSSLQSIKPQWGASIACMIMRAEQLGIIDEDKKQYLLIRLSQFGWRKCEPYDQGENVIPYEQVQLFNKVVKALVEQEKLSEFDILKNVGLNIETFCEYFSVDKGIFRKAPELNNVISALFGSEKGKETLN